MADGAVAILPRRTGEKPALFQNGIIPFSHLVVRKCPARLMGHQPIILNRGD